MLPFLSGEVIDRIATFIEAPADLLAFRLVCRQCWKHSYPTFGATFFRVIESDLSRPSIARLENIANIHGIGAHVRVFRLFIGSGKNFPRVFGSGYHWPRELSGCLQMMPPQIAMLQQILSKHWVNCNSFEVWDEDYTREIHFARPLTSLSPMDALAIVLAMVGEAQRPVTSFCLDFVTQAGRLDYRSLRPDLYELSPFQGLIGGSLQQLELSWEDEGDEFSDAIVQVIHKATGLQRLALQWHTSTDVPPNKFLQSLTQQLAKGGPALTALRLRCSDAIETSTLRTFLSYFEATLSSLTFSRVHVGRGTWSSVLQHLREGFPQLRCLTVQYCFELIESEEGRIFFCALRNPEAHGLRGKLEICDLSYRMKRNRAGGFRYQGEDMPQALQIIQNSIYTLYPGGPPSPGLPAKPLYPSGCPRNDKVVKFQPSNLDPFDSLYNEMHKRCRI